MVSSSESQAIQKSLGYEAWVGISWIANASDNGSVLYRDSDCKLWGNALLSCSAATWYFKEKLEKISSALFWEITGKWSSRK